MLNVLQSIFPSVPSAGGVMLGKGRVTPVMNIRVASKGRGGISKLLDLLAALEDAGLHLTRPPFTGTYTVG